MYEIIFTEKAENQLKKLEKSIQDRILSVLERVRIKPEKYFKKLVGEKAYRLKIGKYRVIVDIIKNKLIILVLKVGHRKKEIGRAHV